MSNIERIKAEIERLKAENRNIRCQHNDKYCNGYDDAFNDLLSIIESLSKEKPSEDLLDAAKDALLLERAWLTLDGFGHEELAERLRDYAERKGLIWK